MSRISNLLHFDRFGWCRSRVYAGIAHITLFALSGLAAYLLRFDFHINATYRAQLLETIPIWIVVKMIIFSAGHLNRGLWKYVSVPDLISIAFANLLASALSAGVIYTFGVGFPRSVAILDFILCLNGTVGLRVAMRLAAERRRRSGSRIGRSRTLIYGGGAAGMMLLREIRDSSLRYEVCGFIDDDPGKKRMFILRVPVLGTGKDLAALARAHRIAQVLIAIPSATGEQMTRILENCHDSNVPCKTVPGFKDIIEGRGLSAQIREVAVEDLLGRNPVMLDESGIREHLQSKVVMVTGAGGSIGSELCRQIARFEPQAIIGFEIAETALFQIEQVMLEAFPTVRFIPEIGSIQNPARLDQVIAQYSPAVIYHAAAYKHVPMMETHIFEAAQNNILGTYNVAAAAARHGVERFIMISSDKAVHPVNIMGATKRIAELLINGMQAEKTRYSSVRFGNVLGSNGSVVPIFKKQIAAGGPITVTHPEMRRYFMTIPEAAQLVLQAAAMGHGGEIFVLDMGEPVKIVDLARKMILLSGFTPDRQIKIQFVGIRPGERLYEELRTLNEDVVPTYHEKIKIFVDHSARFDLSCISALHELIDRADATGLLLEIKDLIPEFNPGAHLLRQLVQESRMQSGLQVENAVVVQVQ
jgi:FlaA1/EpsC-like NDP-sugar epimerase